MLESVFYGTSGDISFLSAAVCTAMSLILGLGIAGIHMYQNQSSRNFLLTLVILPFIVQMVIMMVNGSLGTGIAVMGAFSLVRFRSMPGSAREISSVFLAMAAGLADGIGFVWASAAMVVIAGAVTVAVLRLPDRSGQFLRRELKVTIPEDLDYTGIFDDIFAKYTKRASMLRVKTVNMGSLYELWYEIDLKGAEIEKTMLDEIRCRNGNLPIVCGRAGLESERL